MSQTFENLCDGQSQVKISRIANWGILVFLLHPFHATGLFLYPLKMPKKNMFSDVFRGVKTTSVMKMVTEPNTDTKKTQNVNIKIKQIWRNFFQVKTQIVIKRNESYKVLLLSFFWPWVGWTCFFFFTPYPACNDILKINGKAQYLCSKLAIKTCEYHHSPII